MTCLETFEAAAALDGETRAKYIAEHHPECACESESVSPYSPGVVTAEETIFRYFPESQVNPQGSVDPSVFDNAVRTGFSSERLAGRTWDELIGVGRQWVDRFKPNQSLKAIGQANVADIRAFRFEPQASRFCVYDTALLDNPTHAEIMVCNPSAVKAQRALFRKKLRDLFTISPVTDP